MLQWSLLLVGIGQSIEGFINNPWVVTIIGGLIVTILYYCLFEKRKKNNYKDSLRRELSRREMTFEHFKDMKRELIDPWHQELEDFESRICKMIYFGHENKINFPINFNIEENSRFNPFFSHFPDQLLQWNRIKREIRDCNTKYSEFAIFIDSQIEQECGLKTPEKWTGEKGQLSLRAVLKIINNFIRKRLTGSTYEWRFTVEERETHYLLIDSSYGIGVGTADQIERFRKLIEENELSKNGENQRKAKELAEKVHATLKDIGAFKSQLQEISALPSFPRECELCPDFT